MRTNRTFLIYILFLLSGCTGLIYELVWVRELILILGGTTYAITTVLVAFMSGLALGSFLGGKLSDRLRQPGRSYGLLEIGIGLYGLAVPLLFGAADPLYRTLYPHVAEMPWLLTGVRFLVGSIVLLLPTTCMGATLPILVHYVTHEGQSFGKSVGRLYGINTLGAVLGTMAAGFWLIPAFGLTHTTWIAATVNLFIGLAAIIYLRSSPKPVKQIKASAAKAKLTDLAREVTPSLRLAVLIGFAISGFAAMVYQIAWTRALIMSVGSSTYAFTCILAAFILGLAVGSLVIARWVDRWRRPVLVFGLLELGIALSAILIVPIQSRIPALVRAVVSQHPDNYIALLIYQFTLIIAVTFIPTFLMGAIFPLVTRIVAVKDGEKGSAVGRVYAVNTLGTIFGSFLAGFVLIRSNVLGVQNSIIVAALLNALVGAWLVIQSRTKGEPVAKRIMIAAFVVLMIPLISWTTGEWNKLLMVSGPYLNRPITGQETIEYFGEGVDTTVAVVRTGGKNGPISIVINGKTDASNSLTDMPTQLQLGHLPALLANDGKKACVIGLGSGITSSAVACYSSYELLDCVEISDEVIRAAEHFIDYNYRVLTEDPRVNLIRADGRNHLLLTDRYYDVIISEPSNIWIAGTANLFTREFFGLCKNRLTDDGRLCIWLHSYSISLDDFKTVVRTLCDVFDFVSVWQAWETDYLLIAGRKPFAVRLDELNRRFQQPNVREDLYRIGFSNLGRVIGGFITSGEPLRQWAASAPVHTDDNTFLEFSVPKRLHINEGVRIIKELMKLQRSVFDEVLVGQKTSGVYKQIQVGIDTFSRIRLVGIESMLKCRQEDYYQALRLLYEEYQRSPDSVYIYQLLRDVWRHIEINKSKLAITDSMRNLHKQVGDVLPPFIGPRTGVQLSKIAKDLRASVFKAVQNSQWEIAISRSKMYFDIHPTDGQVVMWWAAAYIETDRVNQAIQLLDGFLQQYPNDPHACMARGMAAVRVGDFETALSSLEIALQAKVTTISELRKNPYIQTLSNDPRFRSLIDRYAKTQPATGPS